MNEELKFQKLSEVELLEEAPEDAHPLVETGGTIKRVVGSVGGGSGSGGGIPVFDLTPYLAEDFSDINAELLSWGVLLIDPVFDEEVIQEFIGMAATGAISLRVDLTKFFTAMSEGGAPSDLSYIINGVYSTQFFNSGTPPTDSEVLSIEGVLLYGGLRDLMLIGESGGGTAFATMVGYMGGEPVAHFCIPSTIYALMGGTTA